MKTLIGLMVTVFLACPGLSLAEEGANAAGGANEATTVKSSKSNSSERVGAPQGGQTGQDAGQAQSADKVKGSKSNSSERTTVKSGKSNSSD